MTGEDHLHIIEKGEVQEWSLVVHHTLTFQPQKKHLYKPEILCLRNRIQIIQLQMSGNQSIHFFKENSMV